VFFRSIAVTSAKCKSLADCIRNAPIGRCAAECTVDGVCEFTEACDKCCKYTTGNKSGGICAQGCGDNNICLDADSLSSTGDDDDDDDDDVDKTCPRTGPKVAICNSGSDFCLCLVENNCNKSDCDAGKSVCCPKINDAVGDNDVVDAEFCATP
jgi:hypothetical protein